MPRKETVSAVPETTKGDSQIERIQRVVNTHRKRNTAQIAAQEFVEDDRGEVERTNSDLRNR